MTGETNIKKNNELQELWMKDKNNKSQIMNGK